MLPPVHKRRCNRIINAPGARFRIEQKGSEQLGVEGKRCLFFLESGSVVKKILNDLSRSNQDVFLRLQRSRLHGFYDRSSGVKILSRLARQRYEGERRGRKAEGRVLGERPVSISRLPPGPQRSPR